MSSISSGLQMCRNECLGPTVRWLASYDAMTEVVNRILLVKLMSFFVQSSIRGGKRFKQGGVPVFF